MLDYHVCLNSTSHQVRDCPAGTLFCWKPLRTDSTVYLKLDGAGYVILSTGYTSELFQDRPVVLVRPTAHLTFQQAFVLL